MYLLALFVLLLPEDFVLKKTKSEQKNSAIFYSLLSFRVMERFIFFLVFIHNTRFVYIFDACISIFFISKPNRRLYLFFLFKKMESSPFIALHYTELHVHDTISWKNWEKLRESNDKIDKRKYKLHFC